MFGCTGPEQRESEQQQVSVSGACLALVIRFAESCLRLSQDCAAGKYSTSYNATTCAKGLMGRMYGGWRQLSDSVCRFARSAGSFSGAAAKACTLCPAGRINTVNGSLSCTSCPNGKYNQLPGLTKCFDCANRWDSDANRVSCVSSCPQGTYGLVNGTGCIDCPKVRRRHSIAAS
jgi:hypothetical protein